MQLQSSKEAIKRESDKYLFINTEDMLSLSELCKELSISVATGRNWIKLGKLIPSAQVKRVPYFTYDEVKQIKLKIQNKDSTALKSRRNKKYISGELIMCKRLEDYAQYFRRIQLRAGFDHLFFKCQADNVPPIATSQKGDEVTFYYPEGVPVFPLLDKETSTIKFKLTIPPKFSPNWELS